MKKQVRPVTHARLPHPLGNTGFDVGLHLLLDVPRLISPIFQLILPYLVFEHCLFLCEVFCVSGTERMWHICPPTPVFVTRQCLSGHSSTQGSWTSLTPPFSVSHGFSSPGSWVIYSTVLTGNLSLKESYVSISMV